MKNQVHILLAFLNLFPLVTAAQNGFYIGTEFANKRDYYSFINDEGGSANTGMLSNLFGACVGYHYKNLTIETGVYRFNSLVPEITYDRDFERPYFGRSAHSSDANNYLVIPLRFGYDFKGHNSNFYFQPFLGMMLINNAVEDDSPVVSWINQEEPGKSSEYANGLILPVPDSGMFSYGVGYSTRPYNLGFQAGFSIGYRIKNRLDIYARVSVFNSINLLYYENVIYNYNDELVAGTTSFNGNSTTIGIGVKYYLQKQR